MSNKVNPKVIKAFLFSLILCAVCMFYSTVMLYHQLTSNGWGSDSGQFHIIFSICLAALSSIHVINVFKLAKTKL